MRVAGYDLRLDRGSHQNRQRGKRTLKSSIARWPPTARANRFRPALLGHAVAADLSDPDQIEPMFEAVDLAFGRLDVTVINAGIAMIGSAEGFPLKR